MSYYRIVSSKLWHTDGLSSSARTTVQVEGAVVKMSIWLEQWTRR